jgi:glycerate 2-kinase
MKGDRHRASMDLARERDWIAKEIFRRLDPEMIVSRSIIRENGCFRIGGIDDPQWKTVISVPVDKGILAMSAGKSAVPMLKGALRKLKVYGASLIPGSVAVSPYGATEPESGEFKVLTGNHPYPEEIDRKNTETFIERVSDLEKGELLLFLISGGASSVFCMPRRKLTVNEIANITESCMNSGMSIQELNTIRTHVSDVKGGGLLDHLNGADCATLAISDVIGNDPRFIGSGPTIPWVPRSDHVLSLLKRVGIPKDLISRISDLDHRRDHGKRCDNLLLTDNSLALEKTSDLLADKGFHCVVDDTRFIGEARATGKLLLTRGRGKLSGSSVDAYIAGGETTVEVRGKGKGGRNTEMALSLLVDLDENEYVFCISTDGLDGNSNSAGGMVSGVMLRNDGIDEKSVKDRIRDHLGENDSATLLDELGGLIRTGPSMVNLNDIFVYIIRHDRDHHRYRK